MASRIRADASLQTSAVPIHTLPSPFGTSPERQQLRDRMHRLASAGHLEEAIALTEPHVRLGSRDEEMLRLRAMLERELGRTAAAVVFASRAVELARDSDMLMILARADVHAGEMDRGLGRRREVLAMIPGHVPTRILMAQALESAVRTDEATDVLEPLLADVQGRDLRVAAQVHQVRAAVLVHRKQYGEAIELIDAAILGGAASDVLRGLARLPLSRGHGEPLARAV